MTADLPRPFGPYTLIASLGRGGMGAVYLATRQGLQDIQQLCVVKTLRSDHSDDPEYVSRFQDEARVVVQLGHRNIARVFDVGIVDGTYYMAMEAVRGVDLVKVFEASAATQGLGGPVATYIAVEVLEALDFAHRFRDPATGEPMNIVHRDVSPHNVMVSFEGEVRLIDFGLTVSTAKKTRTEPNVVMGKLLYMSPEQARDDVVDGRTDTFAVAMMLYELLSGRRYYHGLSRDEIWNTVGKGGFVPHGFGELPAPLQPVLRRALAARKEDRFASAGELRSAVLEATRPLGWYAGAPELRARLQTLFAGAEETDRRRVQRAISSVEIKIPASLRDAGVDSTRVVTLASTLGDPVDDDETSTRQLPAGRRSPGGGADSAVGASTGSEETVVGGAPDLSTLLGPAVADDPGDGVVFEDSRPTPAVPSERRATGEDPSGPSSTERVVRVAPVARPAAWSRSRVLWLAGLLGGALAMTAVAVAVALDDADAGPTPVAGPTSPLVGHAERAKDLPEAPPPASTALAGEASAVTDDRAEATAPAAATAPSAASSDEAPGDTEEDAPNADALAEAEDDGTAPAVDPRRGAPPPHRSARRRAHRSATGSTQRNPPPPESQSLPLLVAYLQSQCVHDQPACRGQVLRVAKRVGALSPSEVHTLRARALSCARECSR